MYEAKVIADSFFFQPQLDGCVNRLTTMQLTHPRIVHAEFMTHCMFARNAASSRAIPFEKFVKAVLEDPFIPVWWGKNQPGMQAREEISPEMQDLAKRRWLRARDQAVEKARELHDNFGLHKQICNRLLEPWSWITVCVTGDELAWSNYFAQRCHIDAQPEIEKQASLALAAYRLSKPKELKLGQWHLPYILDEERERFYEFEMDIKYVSAARCARVSYLLQDNKDIVKDYQLATKLMQAKPMHASPFEHVAMASGRTSSIGKWHGWDQLRHTIPGERTADFFRR